MYVHLETVLSTLFHLMLIFTRLSIKVCIHVSQGMIAHKLGRNDKAGRTFALQLFYLPCIFLNEVDVRINETCCLIHDEDNSTK